MDDGRSFWPVILFLLVFIITFHETIQNAKYQTCAIRVHQISS